MIVGNKGAPPPKRRWRSDAARLAQAQHYRGIFCRILIVLLIAWAFLFVAFGIGVHSGIFLF